MILMQYQILYLAFYSTSELMYLYFQRYSLRVIITIILMGKYYAKQLEYYYSHTILSTLFSFIQNQLTSISFLLEICIQSYQYYYLQKYLLCYLARVLLFLYYTSYYAQLTCNFYYQYYVSKVVSTIFLTSICDAIQLDYCNIYTTQVISLSFLQYQLTSTFTLLEECIQSSQYYYYYAHTMLYS